MLRKNPSERFRIQKTLDEANTRWGDPDTPIRMSPNIVDALKPGDLMTCIYNGTGRVCFIVSSARGPSGHFKSTRGNTLLNLFLVDLDNPMFPVILKTIYKNRNKASYEQAPKLFDTVFKKDNFRTFDYSKVGDLHGIFLDPGKF